MQMRVKMQQPAYKCKKMQMRALFVNGPIPAQYPTSTWYFIPGPPLAYSAMYLMV